MINAQFYKDIKTFPKQFKIGLEIAKGIKPSQDFDSIVVCGMGGSSYFVEILEDVMRSQPKNNKLIFANRTYQLPNFVNKKTLIVLASYSGGTEETLACAEEVKVRGLQCIIFTAGGKLEDFAKENEIPLFKVPGGTQSRLSSGFYIAGLIKLLIDLKFTEVTEEEIIDIAANLDKNLEEAYSKEIAKKLVNKVPILYTTDNNISIGRVGKIKFNETDKIQCFYNYFPELNHNEMVGFTKQLMDPFFLIFESKFTNPRNLKRISVFKDLMKKDGMDSEVIIPKGETTIEEILNSYYLIDHITYYLSIEYQIDPEPVELVDEFKKVLEQ